jgi:hypothetical protein
MWRCPVCGQTFVTRNMPHSCLVVPLEAHFAGREQLRPVFDAFVTAARANGPLTINATKSRITLQVRMRFAGVELRRDHLRAHLVLMRPIEADRLQIEYLPPRYYLHRLRLARPEDVDDELRGWVAEAYRVGEQQHVRRSRAPAVRPAPDP